MANIILVAVFAVSFGSLVAGQACPRIITRSQWGARPASTSGLTTFPPSHVIIHHSASAGCSTQAACSQLVRSFQNFHMDTQRWADIGYNFLVGGDGLVYEGRGWGRTGAHAVNFNSRSIGICFIGTFSSVSPTAAALNAAQQLIACGVGQRQIASNYRLAGHRQVSATECPGLTLQNIIRNWRNWTNNP